MNASEGMRAFELYMGNREQFHKKVYTRNMKQNSSSLSAQ
jgi:hypothetical protein